MNSLFIKSLVAFVVGAMLMLLLSFTIYRQSYYYKKALAEAAGDARKPSMRSRLFTMAILLAMVLFFAGFDLWVLSGERLSFLFLSALNLGLVALLSLFDALFIDLFLLVVWRPAFLHLSEGQPTRDSLFLHIKQQFTAGWIFKVPIALLGALFSGVLVAGFG